MVQGTTRSQAVALRDAFGFGFKEFGKKAGVNMAKGIGAGFGAALVNLGLNRWDQNERIEHNDNVEAAKTTFIHQDQQNAAALTAVIATKS